jgi:hypothetical protein
VGVLMMMIHTSFYNSTYVLHPVAKKRGTDSLIPVKNFVQGWQPKPKILEDLAIEDVGIFYGHLVCFTSIRHIFPVLVCCAQKNLATRPLC